MDFIALEFAETYSDVIGYIAFFGAMIAWLYQWKRNRDEKKNELRNIWDNLSVIKAAMSDIEKAEKMSSGERGCLHFGIYQAHAELAVLFRNTLARAISREGNVTLRTIIKWRKSGKLSSDWQQKCAMTILLSEELTDDELEKIDQKFSSWDAIDDHRSPLSSEPEQLVHTSTTAS